MGYLKLDNITVVRMDDVIYTYGNAAASVNGNVLVITLYDPGTQAITGQHHHPLFNIWDWYPDSQETR